MDATRCVDDFDPDFKYTNANVSHSWLINYPESLKPDLNTLKMSTMHETFKEPELHRTETKGRRKKLLEAFYRKMISTEIMGDIEKEEVIIEDYETDYMENFKNPDEMPLPGEECSKNDKLRQRGIDPNDKELEKSKFEDMKSKYPLYFSKPVTFFSQATGRDNFRKNSTITKSPEQNYDNIEY